MLQSASLLVAVPSVLVRECTLLYGAYEPATATAWPVKNGFGIRGINALCVLWLGARL